jgi:hypothetical protein
MTPLYLLIIVFPKCDPLTATEMALCVNLKNLKTINKSILYFINRRDIQSFKNGSISCLTFVCVGFNAGVRN